MRDREAYRAGQTNADGKVICGAKTRSGTPCKSTAVMPNGRCRMHGGASLSGPAHPNFKHGRHSKWLPKGLLATYRDSLTDPELLALKDEIALVDARITEVGGRLDTGEGPSAWMAVEASYRLIIEGMNEGDPAKLRDGVEGVGAAIEQAKTEQETWNLVIFYIDQRRKLVDTERRLEEIKQQTLTAREMTTLVAALVDVIRRHVRDQATLAAISTDVRGLISERTVSLN